MGCIQTLLLDIINDHKDLFTFCECPPTVSLDDLSIKPKIGTPLDKLGFPQRCCGCCPLGVASFFICIISFAWGTYELQAADMTVAQVFPKRDEAFFYSKMVYLLMSLLFILATGGLLLGILIKRSEPVLVYICYGLVFNFLVLFYVLGSSAVLIYRNEATCKTYAWNTLFGVIWFIIFLYALIVVNSYKLKLW